MRTWTIAATVAQVKKSFEKCGKTPCECGKRCNVVPTDWKGKCIAYETFFVSLSKLPSHTQLKDVFQYIPHAATLVPGFKQRLSDTPPMSGLAGIFKTSEGEKGIQVFHSLN